MRFSLLKCITPKYFKDPIDAVHLIQNLTENRDEEKVDAATILYLLGDTLNKFNSTDGEAQERLSQVNIILCAILLINIIVTQVFIEVSNIIIQSFDQVNIILLFPESNIYTCI